MSVPERTLQRYESYLKVPISQADFVSLELCYYFWGATTFEYIKVKTFNVAVSHLTYNTTYRLTIWHICTMVRYLQKDILVPSAFVVLNSSFPNTTAVFNQSS